MIWCYLVVWFFFFNRQNCQSQVQFYRNCPSPSWGYYLRWQFGNTMILSTLVSVFHPQTLLCPVNFNTVYWEVQSNTDVCWQKFYRWWLDSINSMCMMLVFVSLREILLNAPDPVSSSTAVQGLSAEAKHKNNVCISYRDLLTHIFLLRVWNRHVMWWFVK